MAQSWEEVFQNGVGAVANAGADLIRQKADVSGQTNNAPTTASEGELHKYQPFLIIGGIGLAIVVALLVFKKR